MRTRPAPEISDLPARLAGLLLLASVPNICLYMADELLRSYEAVSDLDAVPLEWEVCNEALVSGLD